jgi:FOG: TPR repeat, SEL1 subfamily
MQQWSDLTSCRLSAEKGDVNAQLYLGFACFYGFKTALNQKESIYWFTLAAEQGCAEAQYELAVRYEDEQGVKQDIDEAAKWYAKAAQQGYVKAMALMGDNGLSLHQLAREGSKEAQLALGHIYFEGNYKERNYKKAVYWYKKAAEKGDKEAQYQLATLLKTGNGVSASEGDSLYWYQKAAENGHADAQISLAFIMIKTKEMEKAFYWFQQSAMSGNAFAQYNVGKMYLSGVGAAQDFIRAAEWLEKAALQNDAEAQYWLGTLYDHGHGIARELEKAMYWYQKAAKQGEPNSIEVLKEFFSQETGELCECH